MGLLNDYCAVGGGVAHRNICKHSFVEVTNRMERVLKKLRVSLSSQEIRRLLRNPKPHYHIYKSSPLDPIVSQMNLMKTEHV
jgi:hypothetical protein